MACPFLDILSGQKSFKTPVWLMRQAGRYLPEYKILRQRSENFIDFCLTPELATEATLQPLRRFDLDAAIIFADILLIPHAFGLKIDFIKDEGPLISPNLSEGLKDKNFDINKCAAVFKTIESVRKNINSSQAVIGFSGAAWTLLLYMILGKSPKKELISFHPSFKEKITTNLPIIEKAISEYILCQIDAGAQAIQLFDSWAGLIDNEKDFEEYILLPTQRIVKKIKQERKNIPIIGFPKGIREKWYQLYKKITGVDAISFDPAISLQTIKKIQSDCITQGNLDPLILLRGGTQLTIETKKILDTLNNEHKRHIMGLGHGILPDTPIEHINEMLKMVRQWDQENG